MSISVLKFGGTSVKSISRIQHVADVVAGALSKQNKCIVVVSAMGDTTDYLYGLAKQCTITPDKRELDLLLSTGEQVSIALLALTLKSRGINAKSFTGAQIGITTDGAHSTARILDICKDKLQVALADHDVIVVAGFQGISEDGEITTLGRGGSDTTAVALAAASNAATCDIYTDVDGIYTTDPNKISEATIIDCINYDEVLEMARVGAQVLHPRAVELAKEYNLVVRVRNTFKPHHAGTKICGELNVEKACKISGVVVDGNQAHIVASKIPLESNFVGAILDVVRKECISVDMIAQNIDFNSRTKVVSLAIKYQDLDQAQNSFANQIPDTCIDWDHDVAKVSVIGSCLGSAPEVTASIVRVLETHGILIKQLHCNETRISCLIPKQSASHAAVLLHREFQLDTTRECRTEEQALNGVVVEEQLTLSA